MEDLTGRQFGPYQIIAPLGEGGMAAVYKAYQPAMERYVALKILPRTFAENPLFTARFKREARLLAQLQHPHILPVFDYDQAEGYTYLVMPTIPSSQAGWGLDVTASPRRLAKPTFPTFIWHTDKRQESFRNPPVNRIIDFLWRIVYFFAAKLSDFMPATSHTLSIVSSGIGAM